MECFLHLPPSYFTGSGLSSLKWFPTHFSRRRFRVGMESQLRNNIVPPGGKGCTMNSSDISNVSFTTTKIREGYSRDEVDAFIETVRETLRYWEGGRAGELSSDSVVAARFTPTKFRAGYNQGEVDDFLDDVTATLNGYESGQRP